MGEMRKLFLVDDDMDDHEIFRAALDDIDPSILSSVAFDGREALEKLRSREVTPDVIFLDLNMPVMGGKQFLELIKKEEPLKSIPIYIMSTSSDSFTIEEMKMRGAVDYIIKPSQFSELVRILKSVLNV